MEFLKLRPIIQEGPENFQLNRGKKDGVSSWGKKVEKDSVSTWGGKKVEKDGVSSWGGKGGKRWCFYLGEKGGKKMVVFFLCYYYFFFFFQPERPGL